VAPHAQQALSSIDLAARIVIRGNHRALQTLEQAVDASKTANGGLLTTYLLEPRDS
jgi:hypothetical protein